MRSVMTSSDSPERVVATISWQRDLDAENAADGPLDLAYTRALSLVLAATYQLDIAVRARVTEIIRRAYPTAVELLYDGEHNEDGVLHMYVRQILETDGGVLADLREDPENWPEELIDEEVEPLLWDVSERDESYYGEGRIYPLDESAA